MHDLIRGLNGHPQQQPMVLASPINDTQLIALVASQRTDMPPEEAVAWAVEIVLNSIAQTASYLARAQELRKQ